MNRIWRCYVALEWKSRINLTKTYAQCQKNLENSLSWGQYFGHSDVLIRIDVCRNERYLSRTSSKTTKPIFKGNCK